MTRPVSPLSAATPPPVVEAVPAAAAAAAVNAAAGFKTTQMPVREWWDTPARFKRREVDLSECELINVSSKIFFKGIKVKESNQNEGLDLIKTLSHVIHGSFIYRQLSSHPQTS